ncbi:unnamed protein product [marine sediment metagenome]|uniref:Uncharacterized protein n=1 Tax=marine sediment metagenome TaxID=412755 RepID=X0Y705_9ZZZZ
MLRPDPFTAPGHYWTPLLLHITRCLWLTAFTQSLWALQTAETLDKIEVQGSEKL